MKRKAPEVGKGKALEDRISKLPSEIIGNFLKRLPTKDAVSTSILSRNWRYCWTHTTEIIFNNRLFNAMKENMFPDDNRSQAFAFAGIISKTLLAHTGPMLKFVLESPDEAFSTVADVSQWTLCLSRKGVKELILKFNLGSYSMLSSNLYSCQELRYLELSSCDISPPPGFIGFRSLIVIKLLFIRSTDSKINSFLSKCPVVEELTMRTCAGVRCLKFEAANMKCLFLDSSFLFNFSGIITTLKCTQIKHVSARGFHSAQLLATVLQPLRMPLENLKTLSLGTRSIFDLQCAARVIRSAPNLKELAISVDAMAERHDVPSSIFGETQLDEWGTTSLLHIVKITSFRGTRPELEFLKFLLTCVPSLEIMRIRGHSGIIIESVLKMALHLLQLPRASLKARVVYTGPHANAV